MAKGVALTFGRFVWYKTTTKSGREQRGALRADAPERQKIDRLADNRQGREQKAGKQRMAEQVDLDEELLIIQHYGEMPEVGYHGSLHFLTLDGEGPQLTLSESELLRLKMAVVKGYRRIIDRDLELANRSERIYRGLHRCAINWQRLLRFCRREGIDPTAVRQEVAGRLRYFLAQEVAEVESGCRRSSVNCTASSLLAFAEALGLAAGELPPGWSTLCAGPA